jgi:hypothetical protein
MINPLYAFESVREGFRNSFSNNLLFIDLEAGMPKADVTFDWLTDVAL